MWYKMKNLFKDFLKYTVKNNISILLGAFLYGTVINLLII